MAEPFLGEVRIFPFNFAPRGWALCNGQLLPINQNQPLFSLLGTTYGGDGMRTFALPNLQGSVPIHTGNGHNPGERGGQPAHTLTVAETPSHMHVVNASSAVGNGAVPTGAVLASPSNLSYGAPAALTPLMPVTVAAAGGSQPHQNMQPFLVLNFCIALQGIYPSRD